MDLEFLSTSHPFSLLDPAINLSLLQTNKQTKKFQYKKRKAQHKHAPNPHLPA